MFFFVIILFYICKDNANRTQWSLLYIAEMPLIFCKNSKLAPFLQKEFTYYNIGIPLKDGKNPYGQWRFVKIKAQCHRSYCLHIIIYRGNNPNTSSRANVFTYYSYIK